VIDGLSDHDGKLVVIKNIVSNYFIIIARNKLDLQTMTLLKNLKHSRCIEEVVWLGQILPPASAFLQCFQHSSLLCFFLPPQLTTDLLLLTVTLVNDRPVLSSERAPHINKPATV
jgi:hypothetical protein